MTGRPPIAVVGPTAVGKSVLAEKLALALHGQIVSADSMQVYRGMDVGTAKTPEHERAVPYHCIDLVEPGQPYAAALFQTDARAAIDAIRARGETPVVVGGTGLYLRAALDEFDFPAGELVSPLRAELERRAREEGAASLHAELARVDANAAAVIHPNNVRRTIRALEMHAAGISYAAQAAAFGDRVFHYPGTLLIGLAMDRAALYARIDARVDAMIDAGLLGEVATLVERGYRDALTAMQAIGYKELLPVLDGQVTLDEAVYAVKQASRRYAKRQLTWFRADSRVQWIDVTGMSPALVLSAALDLLESSEHP